VINIQGLLDFERKFALLIAINEKIKTEKEKKKKE